MIVDAALQIVLFGSLVGVLVGLTGLGGGVLLLPILIFALGVPPFEAVGAAAVFMFLTKISGAIVHWHRGNVDFPLALMMAVGSVPGALAGVGALALLRSRYGGDVNEILTTLIGLLLIAVPLLMVVQDSVEKKRGASLRDNLPSWVAGRNGVLLIGLVGGILVGFTSVGSGSVIMLLLLFLVSRRTEVLIGTDIFHAVILTGVAGVSHLGMGTVDLQLVGWLLVGSVPGILLGSNLTTVVSGLWLRRILFGLLVTTGIGMV